MQLVTSESSLRISRRPSIPASKPTLGYQRKPISKIRRSIRLTPRAPIMSECPIFLGAGCLTSAISAPAAPTHSIAPDWLQIHLCQFLAGSKPPPSPNRGLPHGRILGDPEVELSEDEAELLHQRRNYMPLLGIDEFLK